MKKIKRQMHTKRTILDTINMMCPIRCGYVEQMPGPKSSQPGFQTENEKW